jgi:hypothetical protein
LGLRAKQIFKQNEEKIWEIYCQVRNLLEEMSIPKAKQEE